ncbi:MAG: DUF4340 domain-containing protein [Rhodospirillaceae bacterium]
MTPKTFLALAGLTAAALIAAVLAVHSRDAGAPTDAGAGQPLIPGLARRINQITVLVLGGAGQTVTLARSDPESSRWAIVDKAGYPADSDQVRRAIVALAGARTLEPRTANPGQYARLGLADDAAIAITLRCADGTDLPGLTLGKTVSGAGPDRPGSFYARRTDEPQSWLAEGRLPPLATDPLVWLRRDLPSLSRGQVAAVTVSRGAGDEIGISRKDPGSADFAVTGLPRGARPRQATVNDLAGAAEMLGFEDVGATEPADARAAAITTTLRSFEGEVLTIRVVRRDGHPWASFTIAREGAAASPEAAERIGESQARHAGWSYRLSEAAAAGLAPSADTLTEPPPAAAGPKMPDPEARRGGNP